MSGKNLLPSVQVALAIQRRLRKLDINKPISWYPNEICLELNLVLWKSLFKLEAWVSDSNTAKIKQDISMCLQLCNPNSMNTHTITMHHIHLKLWGNWVSVNICEQTSYKSDMCIYLMCKEKQLSIMKITHASTKKEDTLTDCNQVILRYCINGIWNCIILFWLLFCKWQRPHLIMLVTLLRLTDPIQIKT